MNFKQAKQIEDSPQSSSIVSFLGDSRTEYNATLSTCKKLGSGINNMILASSTLATCTR